MQHIFPDYYNEFQCINKACKHNCCIGWEIDIAPDTAAFYKTVSGELGIRLQKNIAWEEQPHFILDKHDRCPFLNDDNLCDIILTLGESHLCNICADHPRFRNELPGRIETGLGLCCEEAARLILTKSTPVTLVGSDNTEEEDTIINLRDAALVILQHREKSVAQRVDDLLFLCETDLPEKTFGEWAEIFLSLERLDEAWTTTLLQLKNNWQAADFDGFEQHMANRQTEYEQLLVYLIYRHFANAADLFDAADRAAFAVLGYELLRAIGAVQWTLTGTFTIEDQIELARLFSSEIEYSDENFYLLLDELYV